jgi:hypothetical protein
MYGGSTGSIAMLVRLLWLQRWAMMATYSIDKLVKVVRV